MHRQNSLSASCGNGSWGGGGGEKFGVGAHHEGWGHIMRSWGGGHIMGWGHIMRSWGVGAYHEKLGGGGGGLHS